MKIFTIIVCITWLLASCKPGNITIPSGIWKLEKIEVSQNNELKKIIEAGYQYWKFYKSDSIEIFNNEQVQKCLKLKADNDSFRSIDRRTGDILDEFVIDKLTKSELEISSRKNLDKIDYTVVYYLEKVNEY